MVEPYWEVSRYTGYGRALDIVAKDIYGIEKIDFSTIEELNKKFLKTLKPGHFKKILKDKCRIERSLIIIDTLDKKYDPQEERSIYCDKDYFCPVYNINNLVYPKFWFDTVPLNKISAFGGDYLFVDGIYGHLKLAQQNVAKALSIKVDEGLFDIDKAREVAGMLFYDNPKYLFRI